MNIFPCLSQGLYFTWTSKCWCCKQYLVMCSLAEIKHSDWLKIEVLLGTANQSALLKHSNLILQFCDNSFSNSNSLAYNFFKKLGHFRPLLIYFPLFNSAFNTVDSKLYCRWLNSTADLWFWKRLLYQLRHKNCPIYFYSKIHAVHKCYEPQFGDLAPNMLLGRSTSLS